jgi:predicted nucleic acid-binding protein
MTTAVDTNIFVTLWDNTEGQDPFVRSLLDAALGRGNLVVAAPVYTELLGFPSRTEAFLDTFFQETGIFVDWNLNESIWRAAGRAFQGYAGRRRKHRDLGPRRILADFLIGAHALRNGFPLLTFDDRIYRAAFPRLVIVTA